ncbi:MAG TPA: alpha/beta hydrolase [Bryobacteraceae bacterium]|jgi:pimeloyl-ACP methyl ester carboxylesterase|nr:alpha/beta hydrolase [Bryobacteraceae bacterium]
MFHRLRIIALRVIALIAVAALPMQAADFESRVTQGYADSNGVKIHYATLGSGPLVVMIHGFPDFWYTWRDQMAGLADKYQCVAIDQRGYNLSDKPKGVENYDMKLLVGDVIAVIKHFGKDKAIVVGHDWGGAVAWTLALSAPQFVDRLIILNLPHLRGIARELAHNPKQQAAAEYARRFQEEGAEKQLKPEQLAFWVKDPDARVKYIEAFERSDLTAMLNYYRRNYPRPPYQEDSTPVVKTQMPVLMFHGLKDTALLSGALNNTWDWMGEDLTLVTIPGAGHFVQQDASGLVTRTMRAWLDR